MNSSNNNKISTEKKEKLKRFINGFKNEHKIDTAKLCKETRKGN